MRGVRTSELKRDQARHMRLEGHTLDVIASALGVPRATIHDVVTDVQTVVVRYCALCGGAFTVDVPSYGQHRLYCSKAHAKKAGEFGLAATPRGRAA